MLARLFLTIVAILSLASPVAAQSEKWEKVMMFGQEYRLPSPELIGEWQKNICGPTASRAVDQDCLLDFSLLHLEFARLRLLMGMAEAKAKLKDDKGAAESLEKAAALMKASAGLMRKIMAKYPRR